MKNTRRKGEIIRQRERERADSDVSRDGILYQMLVLPAHLQGFWRLRCGKVR